MPTDSVRIGADTQECAAQCAAFVLDALADTLRSQPRATFGISGGESPRLLFAELAKANFDWSKVHFFWVDERCVPPDDKQSNFKLANETLLLPAKIPHANIHRVHGELTPEEAAVGYLKEIQSFFSLAEHAIPSFDLLHRGMGPDAHTASLFPGEELIGNRTGITAPVWVGKLKSHRVTLLPKVLEAARHTVLLVAGADKADALYNVLKGPEDEFQFPCQIGTRNSSAAVWFVDRAAASKL